MKTLAGLDWLSSVMQRISWFFAYISAALVFIMMVCIIYDVVMRHFIGSPTQWVDEYSCYFLVAVIALGAAYTLVMDGHIRVEVIIAKLPGKIRSWLKVFTDIASLGFFIIFVWYTFELSWQSFRDVTLSSMPTLTPLYIPQLAFGLGLMFLSLQMMAQILRDLMKILEKK